MEDAYRSYLELLETLREKVEALSELARKKIEAAKQNDLMALNEVIKQEQALALSFRGLEISREKLLKEMGLQEVALSQLETRYPLELRENARQAAAALQEEYQSYQGVAKTARGILERNLYEVEGIIQSLGGVLPEDSAAAPVPMQGPGYRPPAAEPVAPPPPSMRTDFRA